MSARKVPFYRIHTDEQGKASEFSISDSIANEHMPHRHDHYMVYVMQHGETVHQLDFEEFTIKAPALVFIAPGQVHSVISSQQSKIVAIAFNAAFLTGMDGKELGHLFHTSLIQLEAAEFGEVQPYIALLQKEFARRTGKSAILSNLLTAFLQKCEHVFHKYHEDAGREHYNQTLQRFLALVDDNFKKLTRVSEYASLLFITAGHLNDIVKDITGKNAKQFIDYRRILEAKRLLYWSGGNIKTIAWELGFEDAAYFARYFNKHTGELPRDFQLRVHKTPHS